MFRCPKQRCAEFRKLWRRIGELFQHSCNPHTHSSYISHLLQTTPRAVAPPHCPISHSPTIHQQRTVNTEPFPKIRNSKFGVFGPAGLERALPPYELEGYRKVLADVMLLLQNHSNLESMKVGELSGKAILEVGRHEKNGWNGVGRKLERGWELSLWLVRCTLVSVCFFELYFMSLSVLFFSFH